MDLIGDGKTCEEVCKHAPPEKDKWPCIDCDMRWHDRAEKTKEADRRNRRKKMNTKKLDKIPIDRLGLAYCRMNCFIWDEIFGKPPKDWDSPYKGNKTRYKDPHFQECFRYLESRLTRRQQSMYWWTIELKRSYQEWAEWYDKHGNDLDYVVKKGGQLTEKEK